jgi:hypothetical protein
MHWHSEKKEKCRGLHRGQRPHRVISCSWKVFYRKWLKKISRVKKTEIEEGLERYKSLILQIAKYGKADFLVWVEGTEMKEFEKQEKDLNLLERSNLIRSEMKYTERDAYLECTLTETGAELAEKLLRWNWR